MTDRKCPEGGTCNHEWHEHCPNEFINPCENQCELCKEETIHKRIKPMTDKMTIEQAIKVLKSLELQLASENFSKALEVAIEALEFKRKIVRCKNCIHWQPNTDSKSFTTELTWICMMDDNADHFCSRGERLADWESDTE